MSVPSQQSFSMPIRLVSGAMAAGLVCVGLAAMCGLSLPMLAAVFLLGLLLTFSLWNSHWGLCIAAFSLIPLGSVRQEIIGITFNLPEVLILALAAKEAVVCILRRERLSPRIPRFALGLFLCAALVALGVGLVRQNGLVNIFQDFRQFTEFTLLFWLVLQRAGTRQQAMQILACFVAGATFGAIHGILQRLVIVGFPAGPFTELLTIKGTRIGSFHHPNSFGGLMTMAVSAAIGLGLATTRPLWRILVAISIGLCLIAEVYTASRGAWLGLLVSLAFIAVFIRFSKRTTIGVAAAAVLFAGVLGPFVFARLSTLSEPEADRSLMGRAQYYTAAVHIIRAHPLFGLGWGCYYDVPEIVLNERFVETPRPSHPVEATVHSLYLQLFVKMGAFGVIGFLAILVAWTGSVFRNRLWQRASSPEYCLFVGVSGGLTGYLLQNGIENIFHQPVMAQSFWLLLGLSFLTASFLVPRKTTNRVPFALVGVGVCLYVVFVFGCIKLGQLDSGIEYFEKNVAEALARGNRDEATKIARNATQIERPLPLAHALYGRLLLQGGQTEAGLQELRAAVAVKELSLPPFEETREPYYSVPARLELGQYYLGQGQPREASVQFELARADAAVTEDAYKEFREAMYQAYARQGLWGRALALRAPSEEELGGLEAEQLLRIARISEGNAQWDAAQRLSEQLLKHQGYIAESHYLQGRVKWSEGQLEASLVSFEQARALGHPLAGYYAGTVCEALGKPAQAARSYLGMPAGDVFGTLARVRALQLCDSLPAEDQAALPTTREELSLQVQAQIAAMHRLPATQQQEQQTAPQPQAVLVSERYFQSGGRFPILLLWEGKDTAKTDTVNDLYPVPGLTAMLQLQWVENLVNWESVEQLPEGSEAIPGWIDTGHEWFGLHGDNRLTIRRDSETGSVLYMPRLTWGLSVPTRAREGAGYLIAGRIKGQGSLGWQALNAEGRVIAQARIFEHEGTEVWSWRGACVSAQQPWEALRIQLDMDPLAGTVSFDEIMLIPYDALRAPASPR